MRVPGRSFVLALCLGCAAFASASPIDFRAHVLDPPVSFTPSVQPNPIGSLNFQFSFVPCQPGELPNGIMAEGCFAATNQTHQDWTSITFGFANTPTLQSQPASCAPAPSNNIFGTASCSLDPDGLGYTLTFSGGVLTYGDPFFVTEDGVDPALFPLVTANVLSVTTTPEPGSLLLLSTGAGALAMLRRRLRP